jgi:hypothetical protein
MRVIVKGWTVKGAWRLEGEKDGIPLVGQYMFCGDLAGDGEFREHIDGHWYRHYLTVEERDKEVAALVRNFSDPWALLQEFTGIRTVSALLAFLNSTGYFCYPHDELTWQDYEHDWSNFNSPFSCCVTHFWQVQKLLAEMLLSRKPVVGIPKDLPLRWVHALGCGFTFHVRHLLGEYVAEVPTQDTLTTLFAIAQLKVLQAGRFRVCKRSDCGRIFEFETRGRRKNQYCSHLCAHTAWQRRERKTRVQITDERLPLGYGDYKGRQ